jgi:hypothetical protein
MINLLSNSMQDASVNVFLERSFHRLNSPNRPNDRAGIANSTNMLKKNSQKR